MLTMVSSAVKQFSLEEQVFPDAVGRSHEARNIPCFNFLSQKEDNAPEVTISLLIESVGLPNHFLHHIEPSEVQSRLPIRDEWA